MDNKKLSALLVSSSLFVVFACTRTEPVNVPPVVEGEPPASPQAPLVARAFECDPTAVTADTTLAENGALAARLVLRPSGVACANHLVYVPQNGSEQFLSSEPGMIVLAELVSADPASPSSPRVACLSNEKHSQDPAGTSLDRRPDGVVLECAVYTSAWSKTFPVVPSNAEYAAWVVSVKPGATASDKMVVRWLRDSMFQFLHTDTEGRPATDGIYETEFTAGGVVGQTVKLDIPMFESSAKFEESP